MLTRRLVDLFFRLSILGEILIQRVERRKAEAKGENTISFPFVGPGLSPGHDIYASPIENGAF
jgi:hypothetical protein